ncbi:zinc finger, CCHC-type containing protein, partial [Tanacetum coccineum]
VLSCGCLCLLYGVAMHWADFQEMLLSTVLSCGCLCLLYGVAMHWADFQEMLLSTVYSVQAPFGGVTHNMGKAIVELHTMLKLHEKVIPKKVATPAVLAIRGAKDPTATKKRDNLTKDSICHHCKEVGHWRRNSPSYHAELKKKRNIAWLALQVS